MKHKEYAKPTMNVVKLKRKASLLGGSGNTGNNPGYNGPVGYLDPFQDPKA